MIICLFLSLFRCCSILVFRVVGAFYSASYLWPLVLDVGEWGQPQHQGGPRQGDPFSPSLCIIIAKSLSQSLDRLYSQYPFVWYCFVAPIVVSHLSLADDVVIFVNESFEQLISQTMSNFYIEGSISTSYQAIIHFVTNIDYSEMRCLIYWCK